MERKIELGKRYFLRMRPVRRLPFIGWGFTSSNDPDPWVECEVVENGLIDYGKCEDNVSVLTYDLYRNNRENIKRLDEWWWLVTPDLIPPKYSSCFVRCISSDGGVARWLWQ